MIETLITALLQISATDWQSQNLTDSQGVKVHVYHQRLPQGRDFPAVVYHVIAQTPDYVKGKMGLQDYLVQFNVHHADDFEAATIAQGLVDILEGWKGESNGKTWKYIMHERTVDLYDDSQQLAGKTADFRFSRDN